MQSQENQDNKDIKEEKEKNEGSSIKKIIDLRTKQESKKSQQNSEPNKV